MTGAELKTILGGLGLSPPWFADYVGVQRRTVVRWFDQEEPIPDRAAEAVAELREITASEMRDLLTVAQKNEVLLTYRVDEPSANGDHRLPASWHRMVVFRVLERLRADGDTATVVEYVE